uniref:Zinc finger protein 655 n=1 Tax=Castor canadensis TaxID=51338 RepID=A0A8C0WHW5_CASCN
MEEISAQETAGSPRVHFQSVETLSECLSPEPQFVQDINMEQGLTEAPPVPQVPALPHEGSPGDQAAALLTARYQGFQSPSVMGSPSWNKICRPLIWKPRIDKS